MVKIAQLIRVIIILACTAATIYSVVASAFSIATIYTNSDSIWPDIFGVSLGTIIIAGSATLILYSLIYINLKVLSDLLGVVLGLVLLTLWFTLIPSNDIMTAWMDFEPIPMPIRLIIALPLLIFLFVTPFWFIIKAPVKISSRIYNPLLIRVEGMLRNTAEQGAAVNP